jgi:hypothetical protein
MRILLALAARACASPWPSRCSGAAASAPRRWSRRTQRRARRRPAPIHLTLDTDRRPGWSEIDAVELDGPDGHARQSVQEKVPAAASRARPVRRHACRAMRSGGASFGR